MMRKLATFAIAVLCMVLIADQATIGQDARRPGRSKVPEFERNISVNYMLVDVIVTDGRGNYVRNLSKDDFEVFENGKLVTLQSLDEYQMGVSPTETVADMAQGELVQQQPPRNIIILMDLFYSSSYGIKRAVEVAEDFVVDRIQPGDRVMVISYFNSMKIVQPFTSDKNLVIKAMNESGFSADGRTARQNAAASNSLPMNPGLAEEVSVEEELGQRLMDVQNERLFAQKNARNYILSLKALSEVMKNMNGRKTLIMLSEGVDFNLIDPTELNDESFGLHNRQSGQQQDEGASPQAPPAVKMTSLFPDYQDALEQLNDAKVSIYTVNVAGLEALGAAENQFGERDIISDGQSMRPGANSIKGRQEFLSGIAKDTGGRAYFNTNNLRSLLNKIEVDVSNYYILGYQSQFNPKKSEYRKISVRLKKPGLKALHRKGFFTPQPFESLDQEQRDLHLVKGLETAMQLNELKAITGTHLINTSLDDVRLAVAINIPAETLETNKKNQYDLQLLVSNLDQDSKIFSSVHKRMYIDDTNNPALEEKGIRLIETVDAQFGLNKIRVALRDNNTGSRSYFYINQVLSKPSEENLLVASPVFYKPDDMKRAEEEFKVRVKQEDKWNNDLPGGADVLLHPVAGKLFPKIVPQYTAGNDAEFLFSVYNVDRDNPVVSDFEMVFAVSLVTSDDFRSRDWKVLPNVGNIEFYKHRSGIGYACTGGFSVPELEPGVYDFLVQITDKVSSKKNFGYTRMVVNK